MKRTASDRLVIAASYLYIGLFAIFCIYPLLLTISVSLSDNRLVMMHGYKLIPEKLTLDSYEYIFRTNGNRILNSYGVSIAQTVVGTLLSILVTSMMAFAIMWKKMKYRNVIAFFSYFAVIFSAGLVPWYIVCVNYLHLKNTIFALILPYTMSVWNLFLLRNFFKSIPDSIFESADIDGANYFHMYWAIGLPLAKTALLTVSLLYSLEYWNDWFLAVMLITERKLYPLQYYLYIVMSNVQAANQGQIPSGAGHITFPTETSKMVVTVVTIGPIMFLYPFFQKYFVNGIVIGAVKG
jgi:putative aldouronate transport system permease protein